MSSRALRRLQGNDILSNLSSAREQESGEESEGYEPVNAQIAAKKKNKKNKKRDQRVNAFALLNDDDAGDDSDKDEDAELVDDEEAELGEEKVADLRIVDEGEDAAGMSPPEEAYHSQENTSETNNSPEHTTNKPKKKKKKKKKKSGKDSSEQTAPAPKEESEDEIERAEREVNEMLGLHPSQRRGDSSAVVVAETGSAIKDLKSFLSIDYRNLNPDEEMKRRFGASALQQQDRGRRNPHARQQRKATKLVALRPSWGMIQKTGIEMNQTTNSSGSSITYFTFDHTTRYQKVQFLFMDAVDSMNHNNIVALLNQHPYHVDCLLQMSEVCKLQEETAMAAELIERALYIFESSFHTLFNVSTGTCRLDFKRAENRPFFLALFRHINYVGLKACYRTSLEFCKLLLGLDPADDPLASLLMIDYYAIKAEQYDYLIHLHQELDCTRNISMLPNFAFSTALAHFHKGNRKQADQMLERALLMFPSTLSPLMDKCQVSLDSSIIDHALFAPVTYITQSKSLNQLCMLYVCRCFHSWKEPEVLTWLTETCTNLLGKLDQHEQDLQENEQMRSTKFASSPRNVLRHIFMCDYKEVMSELPSEVRTQTVQMHDPLPPIDSVRGYERPPPAPRQPNGEGGDGMMSLFLRSLMPSFGQEEAHIPPELAQQVAQAVAQGEAALQNGEGAVAAGGVNGTLHDGANRLMGAMRELLNTMTYRGDLDQNQIDGNNEQVQGGPQPQDENDGEDEWQQWPQQ